MFWTVLKADQRKQQPEKRLSAVIAVWRSARARSTREARRLTLPSHTFSTSGRPEDALRQERSWFMARMEEGSDVLVVDREIPADHNRLDQPDQKGRPMTGAWERSEMPPSTAAVKAFTPGT